MNGTDRELLKLIQGGINASRLLGWPEGKFVDICMSRVAQSGDRLSAIENLLGSILGDAGEAVSRIQVDFKWTDERFSRTVNRYINVSGGNELLGFCNMLKEFKRTGAIAHEKYLRR